MNAPALPAATSATPAATPTPGPSTTGAGAAPTPANETSPFARELQAARTTQTAPAARSDAKGDGGPSRPEPTKDSKGNKAQAEGESETAHRALLRRLAAALEGKAGPADGEVGSDDAVAEEDDATLAHEDADARMPADASALHAAGRHGPRDAELAPGSGDARGDGAPDAAQDLGTSTSRPAPGTAAAASPASGIAAGEADPAAASPMAPASGADIRAADAARSDAGTEARPAAAPPTSPAFPGFAAELARHAQAIADPSAAAGPGAELRLPTPVHSPQFVPHLAGELALLARDGVQEARVQVHPAELGPIAVRITLDGNAAQVRLVVDSAFTRDLLEQGLPTLAAAMRESGLTLSGGGVFQQPRDPSREGQGGSAGHGTGNDRGAARDADDGQERLAGAAPLQRLRQPGRLDVFA